MQARRPAWGVSDPRFIQANVLFTCNSGRSRGGGKPQGNSGGPQRSPPPPPARAPGGPLTCLSPILQPCGRRRDASGAARLPSKGRLAGGRGALAEPGKGRTGRRAFSFSLFLFLTRCPEAASGGPAQVAGGRAQKCQSRSSSSASGPAQAAEEPSARAARLGRGAAAASAAIAAASLANVASLCRLPARRPDPARAPPLLLLHRLPPARALARSLAPGWRRRRRRRPHGRASCTSGRGAAAETAAPGAAGAETARRGGGELRRPRPGARGSLRRCRGCCPGRRCPARRRRRPRSLRGPRTCVTDRAESQRLPGPAPTSAALSHWAAGLFRRNNKTCQSGRTKGGLKRDSGGGGEPGGGAAEGGEGKGPIQGPGAPGTRRS